MRAGRGSGGSECRQSNGNPKDACAPTASSVVPVENSSSPSGFQILPLDDCLSLAEAYDPETDYTVVLISLLRHAEKQQIE